MVKHYTPELQNNLRRETTKGQKAMSYAVMFPKGEQGKRNDLLIKLTSDKDKDPTASEKIMISQARTIIKYTPELQNNVLTAAMGLNEAMPDD